MFKKENGITLVALVVTIIVLLILAGVYITMISGDDGIATRASQAASKTDVGNVEDAINLAITSAKTEHYAKFAEGTVTSITPTLTIGDVNAALSGYVLKADDTTKVIADKDAIDVVEGSDATKDATFTATFTVEETTDAGVTTYVITDVTVAAKAK